MSRIYIGLDKALGRGGARDRSSRWLLQRRRGVLIRCIVLRGGIGLLLGRRGLLKRCCRRCIGMLGWLK